MRITKEFSSYNHRRYSRPWIAKVTGWPVGSQPTLQWGTFLGQEGEAGECEIEAEPGDLIRWGQKDNRNPKYSTAYWGKVEADGMITTLTAVEARRAYERH